MERRPCRRSAILSGVEQMFLGQYEHTVDEKGRVTIPARYRDDLVNGAFVTQGFDNNLMVLTAPTFDQLYERINQMSLTDPNARQLKRHFFSLAERCEIDRAGRLLLPQFLREKFGLQGTVVFVGAGNFFEIWSPEHWAQQNEAMSDNETNAQRFTALDLSIR